MTDCIFCKIAQKQIPSKIAYEDDAVIAFYLSLIHISHQRTAAKSGAVFPRYRDESDFLHPWVFRRPEGNLGGTTGFSVPFGVEEPYFVGGFLV